jgi:hypothetical protein
MTLPPLIELLGMDGDERIVAGPDGRNRYGRSLTPSPALAFGSSTASSISRDAWGAVAARRNAWLSDARRPDAIFAEGVESLRSRFATLYGLDGTAMIVTPSGTDAHLLAALLLAGPHNAPLTCLSVEASETGRGVMHALGARRFNAQGGAAGDVLSYGDCADAIEVAARDADGQIRSEAEVLSELDAHIATSARAGRRALLVVTDVSKTGLIAPAPQTVAALKGRWGAQLDVLIDACQLRLSPAALRGWLDQDCLVAVTGSKFAGGPAFSGLLLLPERLSRRLKHRTLPRLPQLGHPAQWPQGFAARRACEGPPAFGVLARWEAALYEMARFFAFDESHLAATTQTLSVALSARLAASHILQPVAMPPLPRATKGWDTIPTILPFTPASAHTALDSVQIGQPVRIGRQEALRLCLSMPLIARAAASEAGMQAVLAEGEAAVALIEKATQALAQDRRAG